MLLNPEYIRTFAQTARRSLQNPDVPLPRVLLLRLRDRQIGTRTRQCSSINISTSRNEFTHNFAERTDSKGPTDQRIASATDISPTFTQSPAVPKRGQPLPTSCPGCGALAQETEEGEAGYYSRSRKAVKAYFKALNEERLTRHDELEPNLQERKEQTITTQNDKTTIDEDAVMLDTSPSAPVCDRCHDLIHNASGKSIAHPSIEDLADSIAESPFRKNHVYHVLDAADFPMSLISSVYKRLELAKPRGQNRRSQHTMSRKPTLSFIITRSDLLGRNKDMVDKMMPYFQSILRSALGRMGEGTRLGNVHLVSSKRGWWTKDIKDAIWNRGGGNWLLGKFNVGKSNLFEVLFPKGSGERAPVYAELAKQRFEDSEPPTSGDILAESSLLPPPQPEKAFPVLPLVSSLPGTTASPIRLPFGKHRGELVDLPGLARGNLEQHVLHEHRQDLVMTHRPTVTQFNIKAGQSLLLGGGLIRLTPMLDEGDPSTVMMAYPFVPLEAHITSTEKAIGIQSQESETGVKSLLAPGVGSTIRSAGVLRLDNDVTKKKAQPLLRAGVPLSRLPFRVFSTDILIEGVGWVELVCQIRRQRSTVSIPRENTDEDHVNEPNKIIFDLEKSTTYVPSHLSKGRPDVDFPRVEIFTPNGKHIGQRPPLGAWNIWNGFAKQQTSALSGSRPRRSMKGVKKKEKLERRATAI